MPFFFMFKHSWAPNRSWKIIHWGPGKSWIFLSVKEWEPWINSLPPPKMLCFYIGLCVCLPLGRVT